MAKAFDTLSHNFLDKVLKFFGFGPTFRGSLSLIGKNRTACILLDNGLSSRNFGLGRGRPQGDNISPLTFNFCMQILIFRIELDPSIKPIPRNPHAPLPNNNIPPFLRHESNRETSENEGLADDCTTLTLLEFGCLRSLKNALEDFRVCSGLACNYDKSVIVPINPINQETQEMIDGFGFSTANSFKLLGIDIFNQLDNYTQIYENLITKLRSLVNFWTRFKLTLPGPITIMKTCLISQLNHVGCFLPMPDDTLSTFQAIINQFVKNNLPVSAERLYLKPEDGGLGIFNLKEFFCAQHCSWIRRAELLTIDNWRYDLAHAAPLNNIFLIRKRDVDPLLNPILYNLVSSYCDFYSAFSAVKGNYKTAYIFDNDSFRLNNEKIDLDFFGINFYNAHKPIIRSLTFSQCFMGPRMKTPGDFAADGLPLSPAVWMRLQAAILQSRNRLRKFDDSDNLSVSIGNFCRKIKKGSKLFRTVFYDSDFSRPSVENLRTVAYFSELISVPLPSNQSLKKALGTWMVSSIPNDMQNFLFLLRNNTLPLNNRIHAFDNQISPMCTFCRIADRDTANRDSFSHFFFSCPFTNNILLQWSHALEPAPDINTEEFKVLYWYGSGNLTTDTSGIVCLLMDTFKYCLWKAKQRKRLPNPITIIRECEFLISIMCLQNRKLRDRIRNTNLITNFLQARG